jgi:6,7-dimethyl-8-ribityllumazine synthase
VSGSGRPDHSPVHAPGVRVGVVATRWNAGIVDVLVRRALDAAREAGAPEPTLVRVAGAMEIPVVAQRLARGHDAVVALGCVIRGETPHFDHVCQAVNHGLSHVALHEETAVGNGVLTCNTEEQARVRSGVPGSVEDKGYEAMMAALDTVLVLRGLDSAPVAAQDGRERVR